MEIQKAGLPRCPCIAFRHTGTNDFVEAQNVSNIGSLFQGIHEQNLRSARNPENILDAFMTE
jgi:hypothetical protein